MMQRRRLWAQLFSICIPLLAFSGCSGLIGPPPAGTIYPVAPSFPKVPEGEPTQKVSWALSILQPDASRGLNSDRLALIQPDGTLDYYASATYPDSLPALVQSALLTGFETSGRIVAVARDQDAFHADYDLMTEVKNFQANYSEPNGIPQVTVTILAKLVSVRGRNILATFTASRSETASANTTLAVAQALQKALASVITSIVEWTLAAPPPQAP